MKHRNLLILFFLLLLATFTFSYSKLMRFPDINGNKIVFVYAGDLYTVNAKGGIATRLTSFPGYEMFPKFSPDGKLIAFSGEYDGYRAVYVMNANGGEPKQLTYYPEVKTSERMGFDNQVLDWTPDGKKILFRSRRDAFDTWIERLYTIGVNDPYPEPLPMRYGGLATYSPDGTKIAYNRIFREFRTWKRYRGGLANDVWIYDLVKNKSEKITNSPAMDDFPMWYKDRIFFLSDRGAHKRFNLYRYDLKTKKITQITHFTDFDIKWPSLGKNQIVFENGGDLYVFNCKNEKYHKINVEIPTDYIYKRDKLVNAKDFITNFALSPSGKRALFSARGEIFSVPVKEGVTYNLTRTSEINEQKAEYSPDGKWIAFISDKSGEDEIYLMSTKDKNKVVQVTNDKKSFKLRLLWSPDSTKIAFSDKSTTLYYVDINSKIITKIDKSGYGDIAFFSWSPDSNWLAYEKTEKNRLSSVFLYSLKNKKIYRVTSYLTNDGSPIFSPDGKYLYFASLRDFNATLDSFDMNFTYNNMTKICFVTLSKDAKSPLLPTNDEVKVKEEKNKKNETDKKKEVKKEEKKGIKVDIDGIEKRIGELPIPASNYILAFATKDKVYFVEYPTFRLTGPPVGKFALKVFSLKTKKVSTILENAKGFSISNDKKKILFKLGKNYYVSPLGGKITPKKPLDLSGLKVFINLPQEWAEMLNQVYRMERDYFYAPNMNGVNWKGVYEKYKALLPYVAHRYDLNYIIGEMISELNCSHSYVGGGDYPKIKHVNVGLLGADIVLDKNSGYYKISHILKDEQWDLDNLSPLRQPGVKAKEGDYIIAIDGVDLKAPSNPYKLLRNKAGKVVELTLNDKPQKEGSWKIYIKAMRSEEKLRYYDWVEWNREYVEKKSHGQIGYIHIPDMEGDGLNQFVKNFYGQINKKALIIDDRFNGGGFVDQMIVEKLRRILGGMDAARYFGESTYPERVFIGPMVCLANHFSASDGDIFPYFFKHYKLGPVIGTRTWGGVIGIRGYRRLIDNGYITTPEFAQYNLKSQWVIENHGVDPDIPVEITPEKYAKGIDEQLDTAINYLLKKIKEHPVKLPPRPAKYPVK